MDSYEKLRENLNAHSAGAPKSAAFERILRILFTPEEVTVALGMGFAPRSGESIAQKAGVSPEEAEARCRSMLDKSIIFGREKNGQMGYALLPTIPGLFEFPFMAGGGQPMHDELAKLWNEYHHDGLGQEFAASQTPLMRVIPINKTIENNTEVMPFDALDQMLPKAKLISVAHCACRVSGKNCDRPLEVCLIFDGMAQFLIDRGMARAITLEEARDILRTAEEAGLVHNVNNAADRLSLICNCCPCCCTVLRGINELDLPNAVARSRYQVSIDPDLCTGCGICVDERCPVGAIAMQDDIAVTNVKRCIGCGLCVTTCPGEAISLEPRPDAPDTPATTAEMGLKVVSEKGRLDQFMELMKP